MNIKNQRIELKNQNSTVRMVDIKNISQIQKCIKLEISYKHFSKIQFNGQFSYGN